MFRKQFASCHRRPASQPFHKLLLEALEDRLVPTGYSLTDLGTWQVPVPGHTLAFGSDEVINDAGQVILNNSKGQAFLYSNGQLTNLGSLPGDNNTLAYGINNSGQVVGQSSNTSSLHAFLYSKGHMADLNSFVTSGPPGLLATAVAINDSGQIAGQMGLANSKSGAEQAFLYSNGTVTALGSFNSTSELSVASGINASGQVIGFSDSPSSTLDEDGFLYSNGKLTDLGLNDYPVGIDDSSQILGALGLYSNGHMTNLGVPPGYSLFLGSAINSSGQIVGAVPDLSKGFSFVAFLYSNGTWTDLNSLLPAGTGITLTNAFGISDNGKYIVAEGSNGHTYLLTPGQGTPLFSPPPSSPAPPPKNFTVNDVFHAIQQSGMFLTMFLAEGIHEGQEILNPTDLTFSIDNPNNPTYQIPILYQRLAKQNGSEASALYSDFAEWMYWAYQATETLQLDYATNTKLDPQLAYSFVTNIQKYTQQLQHNPLAGTVDGRVLMMDEALWLGPAYQFEYLGGLLDSLDSGKPPDDFQLGFVLPV